MSNTEDNIIDLENKLPQDFPEVSDFTDYRGMYRVSLIVNIGLGVLLCLSMVTGIVVNMSIDDPYGNGLRAEVRAIDNRGMAHDLKLHPEDPSQK